MFVFSCLHFDEWFTHAKSIWNCFFRPFYCFFFNFGRFFRSYYWKIHPQCHQHFRNSHQMDFRAGALFSIQHTETLSWHVMPCIYNSKRISHSVNKTKSAISVHALVFRFSKFHVHHYTVFKQHLLTKRFKLNFTPP